MRRSVLCGLGVLLGVALTPPVSRGDGLTDVVKSGVPVVGADVGAAIPISDYQETADPGGAIAPFVGYQIGENFAFTPILQPQFAFFPNCPCDEPATIISLTAGARMSLNDGEKEVFFQAQGGHYWTVAGPLENEDGAGFNIGGGFNYEFWRGTSLGAYIRYDQASMEPFSGSDSDTTEFLVAGLGVRHRFLPAPPPPPPAPATAQAPPPPPAPVKKKIVLRGVHFDFDKSDIRPDARPILDEAARTLKEYGDIAVSVDGYTDAIGTDAYNQKLSVRRADAVRAYLEAQGVAASRMTVRGFGKSDPVASNDTPEGRAQNRRVELIVKE